jgi:hypothetical protein
LSDLSPDRSLKLVSASISVLYLPTQRTENSLLSQILSSLGSKPEKAADFAKDHQILFVPSGENHQGSRTDSRSS